MARDLPLVAMACPACQGRVESYPSTLADRIYGLMHRPLSDPGPSPAPHLASLPWVGDCVVVCFCGKAWRTRLIVEEAPQFDGFEDKLNTAKNDA